MTPKKKHVDAPAMTKFLGLFVPHGKVLPSLDHPLKFQAKSSKPDMATYGKPKTQKSSQGSNCSTLW